MTKAHAPCVGVYKSSSTVLSAGNERTEIAGVAVFSTDAMVMGGHSPSEHSTVECLLKTAAAIKSFARFLTYLLSIHYDNYSSFVHFLCLS